MFLDVLHEWLLDRLSPKCPVCRDRGLIVRLNRDGHNSVCFMCGSGSPRKRALRLP